VGGEECNLEITTDAHEHNDRDRRTSRISHPGYHMSNLKYSHVEDSKKVNHIPSSI